MVLAACVHAENPQCFDVLNLQYLQLVERTLSSKPELGCSCIYFLAQNKKSMQDILRKPEGIRIFKSFLETFKNTDIKSTGLGALEQILSGGDP